MRRAGRHDFWVEKWMTEFDPSHRAHSLEKVDPNTDLAKP